MADKKISELLEADPLDGTEDLPIVKDGVTVRCSTQDIADIATKTVKISLTSAEILALNATPKVAAPGCYKIIGNICNDESVINTQAHTTNACVLFSIMVHQLIYCRIVCCHRQKRQYLSSLASTSISFTTGSSDPVNKAVVLKATAGDPTTGDSPMDVYLTYTVITLW